MAILPGCSSILGWHRSSWQAPGACFGLATRLRASTRLHKFLHAKPNLLLLAHGELPVKRVEIIDAGARYKFRRQEACLIDIVARRHDVESARQDLAAFL